MRKLSAKQLHERARRIKLVLMDVDGVLTYGGIAHFVDTAGELVELKAVHAQDSIALAWLADSGFKTGVISGRQSRGIEERMKMLRASYVYQHRLDKLNVFTEILGKAGLSAGQCLYLGDDLPDLPVIAAAGIGVAVRNARPEVREAAAWVTRARGGDGAVREAAELLLRCQGLWAAILNRYR